MNTFWGSFLICGLLMLGGFGFALAAFIAVVSACISFKPQTKKKKQPYIDKHGQLKEFNYENTDIHSELPY